MDDVHEEESICSYCNGSGEGMHDGTTCGHCKGSGVELVNDYLDDDADWYYDQMKEREMEGLSYV